MSVMVVVCRCFQSTRLQQLRSSTRYLIEIFEKTLVCANDQFLKVLYFISGLFSSWLIFKINWNWGLACRVANYHWFWIRVLKSCSPLGLSFTMYSVGVWNALLRCRPLPSWSKTFRSPLKVTRLWVISIITENWSRGPVSNGLL